MKALIIPMLEDNHRPLLLAIVLFIGMFIGLLWILSTVAGWIFAVLTATH